MDTQIILQRYNLGAYVKDIIILESKVEEKKEILPFYADGYPGIMFQQTSNGAFLNPKNKELSEFFIYGQTVEPIKITIAGAYKLIIFRLYPFAVKLLFNVTPKEITDDCYNLDLLGTNQLSAVKKNLLNEIHTTKQVAAIAGFLAELIKQAANKKESKIQLAISLILSNQGVISMKALSQQLELNERTLQRQFSDYIGISPKQFAKIIQFQTSMNQLSEKAFSKLTDVVYENGYADQSHFIRSFRKFTNKKPSQFKPKK